MSLTEESESDKERLLIDNYPESSENSTPLKTLGKRDEQVVDKTILKRPSTPPRRLSSANMDVQDTQISPKSSRRLSFPVCKFIWYH
jgi:hypothetical protein